MTPRHLIGMGLILLSHRAALSQTVLGSPLDGTTPPALAQGAPAGTYALSGFETVNLFNGGLNFRLPLASLKGRGGGAIPLVLALERKWIVQVADSNGVYIRYPLPDDAPGLAANFGYGPGALTFRETGRNIFSGCTSGATAFYQETLTRATFSLGDGTEMEFVDAKTGGGVSTNSYSTGGLGGETITCPSTASVDRGRVWVTRDGSAATLITDTPVTDGTTYNNAAPVASGGGPNAYIFTKDGVRYKFTNQRLVEIRDRNGNLTTYSYTDARLTGMTDSLGRTISVQYDIVPPGLAQSQFDRYDLIQYPGYGGGTRPIKVHYCFLDPAAESKTCANYTGPISRTYGALFGLNGSTEVKYNPVVVSYVELPDGRTYQFRYNDYGELTRVKLPTGGGFGYVWDAGVGTGNGLTNAFGGNPYIYRRVKRRIVYRAGDVIEGQTAYENVEANTGCPAASPDWCTVVTAELQDAGGAKKQRSKHFFYGGAGHPDSFFDYNYYSRPLEGREYRTEQLKVATDASDGTVVSATDTLWEQRTCVAGEVCPVGLGGNLRSSAIDLRTRKTTSTLAETGRVSASETTSFDRYNNPLVIDDTGFDGLYRRKFRQYVDTLNGKSYTRPLNASASVDESSPDPTRTLHLRALLSEESAVDPATNANASRTVYEYDVHTGGTPRHNGRTASGAPYRDAAISNERGNLTQVTQHLYALLPTIPSAKTLLTNLLYDDAGNVVGVVDPKGNQTTVQFSTTYASAWPTTVTNAANHSVQTAYDFNTGFPTSFTDANSNTTIYARADLLDRLTSVTFPDSGFTEFKYCDSGSTQACETGMEPNSYRKKTRQDSCAVPSTVVTDGAYDGLGRPIKETLTESATARIIRETQFDFAGRAYRASNPTRSATGSEWTETQYDSLGRVVKTLLPDGSSSFSEPLGHQLTVTDPATKKTQQVKDAFGRIASVTEDPGGPASFTTNYRYSVLDDLLGVCQGGAYSGLTCAGRERTFVYDSLRRLAAATNPESGTLRYTYDDAGNVIERKDGNLITLTTGYDSLSRPLTKTYSDATPQVNYTWDTPFKGGLTRVENTASKIEYLTYDALGRVKSSRQTTNGVPYDFGYLYNVAGALERETYPSQRQVTTCYDAAGRISQVKQKASATAIETVTASVSAYTAHGALQTLSFGGVITESAQYNNRLQPTQIGAGAWQSNLFYCPGGLASCTTNNGNIRRQTSLGNVWDYGYDELNRLQSVTEDVNAARTWRQNFRFDPYGNRWLLNETQTLIPYLMSTPRAALANDPSPFSANNQWNGTAYDAAGNQRFAWGDGTAIGSARYLYDGENRLKKAEVVQSATFTESTEYGYDGDGRRVTKKVGSVSNLVWVYDAMGQLVAEYGETPPMPCTTCYLTADHLGSTRVIWGSDGLIKKLLDYAPFGEEVTANHRSNDARYPTALYPRSGGQAVSMEFTGKERDAETGLDYFGARYLSAAQGRFTSPDKYNPMLIKQNLEAAGLPGPMAASVLNGFLENPQNWNQYAYVRNNPLRFTDPTGNAPAEGHHLITGRQVLTSPLAQEFTNAVKSGPLSGNGYPNQPGFNAMHRAYNAAVEELLSTVEQTAGDRNSWSVKQWKDVAQRILSSEEGAIKGFLEELEANNAGAKAAISAAIASYRVSASVALRVAASVIVEDLASFLRMPLIIMVDPAITNPSKRMQEEIKKDRKNCLLDRATGNCVY